MQENVVIWNSRRWMYKFIIQIGKQLKHFNAVRLIVLNKVIRWFFSVKILKNYIKDFWSYLTSILHLSVRYYLNVVKRVYVHFISFVDSVLKFFLQTWRRRIYFSKSGKHTKKQIDNHVDSINHCNLHWIGWVTFLKTECVVRVSPYPRK